MVAPRTTTAPGQAGAAGQNAAAPGQQGGQQAPRQGRARVLNFGPIRIGFLNGPGDQIGNLVRQMQNAPPAAGRGAAQDPNQQGPNHLGLPVPYLNGQQPPDSASAQSTQNQIMQIQQRLMQDAANLNLEQQQLNLLRGMEHELGRLRAQQQSMQQTTNSNTTTQPQAPASFPVPGHLPMYPMYPQHPPIPLHGNRNEQIRNGEQSLPPGLTLPEGWTLTPLRRVDGANPPPSNVQSTTAQPSSGEEPPSEGARGPTDENGSPLFVPAQVEDDS